MLGGHEKLRARARENHLGLLYDEAAIYRPTTVPTPDFGTETVFVLLDITEANYWSISGREAIVLERLDVPADCVVMLPALTDITEEDEILYTLTETGEIHHFRVTYVFDRSREKALKVSVTEYKFDDVVIPV